jgi:hypothetical protein
MKAADSQNPYIGPDPLTSAYPIFGRDRERAELVDLLIAERIVLLISPSGAGKTSLIEAKGGVRSMLEEEGFAVAPTIRVSLPPAAGAEPSANRYVESTIRCLDPQPQPGQAHPATVEAAMGRLAVPARARPASAEGSVSPEVSSQVAASAAPVVAVHGGFSAQPGAPSQVVFIFDQFEELLTLDPVGLPAKAEFMKQLGDALSDRGRWAVFSMREEFAAALEPFARAIPTRLATHYRLDLLTPDAARDAIEQPAEAAGVLFPAAGALVENLRQISVVGSDGTRTSAAGPYVEPVHLQIVCRRLWASLAPGSGAVETLSDIGPSTEAALTGYYDETVAQVAEVAGVKEESLRNWFEHRLLTSRGLRSQVAEDDEATIPVAAALDALVSAHLVRREPRHGVTWYELAHDRLVQPVHASNEQWTKAHRSEWQRRAALWEQLDHREDLLLTDSQLQKLERWLAADDSRSTPLLVEFAHQSQRQVDAVNLEQAHEDQKRAEERQRKAQEERDAAIASARRTRLKMVAMAAAAVVGFVLMGRWMFVERQLREDAADKQKLEKLGVDVQSKYRDAPKGQALGASPLQSLEAAVALGKMTVATPDRGRTVVRYYERDADAGQVRSALKTLGFELDVRSSGRPQQGSNALWYGPEVQPEDVRAVALALLRAGVGLQMIKPFDDASGKEWLIEVGGKRLSSNDVLTVDDVAKFVRGRSTYAQVPGVLPDKRQEVP